MHRSLKCHYLLAVKGKTSIGGLPCYESIVDLHAGIQEFLLEVKQILLIPSPGYIKVSLVGASVEYRSHH